MAPRGGVRPRHAAIALGVVAAAVAILLAMGRPPICTCGTVRLWHGVVQSAENSQHFADGSVMHSFHGLTRAMVVTPAKTRHNA